MRPFLGREAFPGPAIELAAAGGSFVGQAAFDGTIAWTQWPRAEVERLLPPDLELAANVAAPDLHPVVFVFGEQTHGAILFGGFTVPAGPDYWELAIAIPFVKHRRGRHLHVHVPRMYASYFPPVWNGNTHYGFGKELARMGWQGPIFLVTTAEGTLLVHAAVEPAGGWAPAEGCALPNLAALRAAFALPVVGRKADGTFVSSYFGWDFTRAAVRPADSWVSIDAPLGAGLVPRECHDVAAGTFEVRGMLWRLTWPAACRF